MQIDKDPLLLTEDEVKLYSIEDQLELLPFCAFEDSNEIQKIIVSPLFKSIFDYYKKNYFNDLLESKTLIEQQLSTYLYLTGQDEDQTSKIDNMLYWRYCPSIEEFINDDRWLGKLYKNSLYPYWKRTYSEIFSPGSSINKVIFSGCFTKDTVIDTLNGEKSIEDLLNNYNNTWVLSFNTQTKSWEPDKVINVFSTGIKDIYKITLDNGESFKCTSNHLFLTRNNKWISIDTGLKPGMSMMPYYTRYNSLGYKQVKNNITEKYENIHRIVAYWKTNITKQQVVHHLDYNKLNNNPNNLCIINKVNHYMFHARKGGEQWRKYNTDPKNAEKRSAAIKKAYDTLRKDPERYKEIIKKKTKGWEKLWKNKEWYSKNAKYSIASPENIEKSRQRMIEYNKSDIARQRSAKNAAKMREIQANKSDFEKYIINLKKGLGSIRKNKGINSVEYLQRIAEIRKYDPIYDPNESAKSRFRRRQQVNFNHKIQSIEYVGKEEVYDLTIEKNHNFPLKAGIIAHNSTSSGKSTAARIGILYAIYRILCLRDPRAVLNVTKESMLSAFIISVNMKLAEKTNYEPFVRILDNSDCFRRTRDINDFYTYGPEDPIPFMPSKSDLSIKFPNGVQFLIGSEVSHTVSHNIFTSFCDEVSEKSTPIEIEKTLNLLNSIDMRLQNRFMGSNYIFQAIASSAKSNRSALAEYIKRVPKSPNFKIYNPRAWEIKSDSAFVGDGTTFPVLIGNGVIQSRIITEEQEAKDIKEGKIILENGCFTEDTIVETTKGYKTFKELVNLKKEEYPQVHCINPDTLEIEKSNIKTVAKTREVNELIEFNFNGEIIKCTLDHKLLLSNGTYKMAKDITENDDIMTIEKKVCKYCGKEYFFNPLISKYYKENSTTKKKIGVDASKYCCYKCGRKVIEDKKHETNFKRYGCATPFENAEVRQHYKNNMKKKYNIEWNSSLKSVKDSKKQTYLNKYNVDNPAKSLEIQEKSKQTCLKKYNVSYSFQSKNNKEKSKQTCLKKYGVDNYAKSDKFKDLYLDKEWVNNLQSKIYNTKKNNNSFNKSSPEDEVFKLLISIYPNTIRQHKSEKYPFNCDFYIPERDLYVECNFHWTHGKEPYNENNEKHKEIINKWKSKNTKYYDTAIYVWTALDPLKRKTAKENNLNWIEFFTKDEFKNWL